jgi:hypothetical protein
MKKLYLVLSLLSVSMTFAQLSENFDSAATLPGFWTTFRGENGLGITQDWGVSTARYYSGTNSAFVRYEAGTGGVNEDWLVTSAVDLTSYTGTSLTFYGGQQYTLPYGSVYTIRVSTTSQTDISGFTTLATYAEADFTDILTPALTSLKTVDLAAYDGMAEVYIAFVMAQNDGDNWFIDDVNVTGTLGTRAFDRNTMVALYPNPSNGIVNISTSLTVDNVEIYDVLGNTVKTVRNANKIDISEMALGTYLFKISTTAGNVYHQKIVKN